MKSETSIPSSNKNLIAFLKAVETYSKSASSFRAKVRDIVASLQLEGFSNDVIKTSMREAVKESAEVTPQYLNRIFVLSAEKGGCGFENERQRPSGTNPAKSKGKPEAAKPEAAKPRASLASSVKITDAASLFAALIVSFEGKTSKIMLLAEKLVSLSEEHIQKTAKK
jgi:hypothetical protein